MAISESFLHQLRLVVWLVGLPIIAYLAVSISRRLRAIKALDARLRAEAEQQRRTNPYADMAQLYEAQELLDRARGKKPV